MSEFSPENHPESPLEFSRQLMLVSAENWNSTQAQLCRLERDVEGGDWTLIGAPIQVSLGKSGMAWGIGRHSLAIPEARMKREGDGCSPAGIFAITAIFADESQEKDWVQMAKLPYLSTHRSLKCIDDPHSRHYNQIVDQNTLSEIDWHSHEEMLRHDQRYAIGAVVAHNSGPSPACAAGSCIFLHVWQHEGMPTAGCTASSFSDMLTICRWLEGEKNPLLVQLPVSEYVRYQNAWGLPSVKICLK